MRTPPPPLLPVCERGHSCDGTVVSVREAPLHHQPAAAAAADRVSRPWRR